QSAFTVLPLPPTMSLAFQGKLRDKVGNTPTALAPDGALDGTFRVTVNGGIWPRTVTRLDLRRVPSGGIWDTDPATSYWALGATAVYSTTVLASTQLSVAITIDTAAAIGVRDVKVTNPDGLVVTSVSGFTVNPPAPTLSLSFLGKLRDKVGPNATAFWPDTALDGTFRVTVQSGSGPRTVTRIELRQTSGGGIWDTDPATAYWALGATTSLDGSLLNAGDGTVSFAVADGGSFYVFASDLSPTPFSSGAGFTLTAKFADGTSAVATVTLPQMPSITAVSPNTGTPGASLTVTVTGTNFQSGATSSF